MNSSPRIRHLGRLTRATVRGGDAQLEHFCQALVRSGFVAASERGGRLEWRRAPKLLQDDWPMRLSITRHGEHFEIDYGMFIPWGWIIGMAFLVLVVLPFVGVPNLGLVFALAVLVLLLAIGIRRFDCRPDARFWQQRPRRRWHEALRRMLRESFG